MKKYRDTKNKGLKSIVIIGIILGLFFLREDSFSNIISKIKNFTVEDMSLNYISKLELEEGGNYNIYKGKILNWNGNYLKALSPDGDLLFTREFQFEEPQILFGKSGVYSIDRNLGYIYILNENGEDIEKIEVSKGIFNIREEKNSLALHSKLEGEEGIVYMNFKGEEILKNMDLKNITTYSIDGKNSKYLISNMDMDHGMESLVNTYLIDGKLESTISLPGEIVLFSEFIGKEKLILTNSNLYIIDGEEIVFENQYPFIKDIKIIGEQIYILYDNNLDILDFKGEIEEKFVFPKVYNKILVHKDLAILYGENDILAIKKAVKVMEYEIKDEIMDIYEDGDLIAIKFSDTINLYNLKNK